MTGRETMLKLAIRLTLLMASALAIPASTAALTADVSDIDAGARRHADAPATAQLWEQPVASAAEVVTPSEPPPVPPVRARSANPLWAIPLTTLSSTRERPIFSASRRPPPPAVAEVAVAKPPPAPKPPRVERPQLSLVGTIAGSEQSFGIFVDQSTKAVLRLKIGEDYQGWRLYAVQGRETTLVRDQQTIMLSLPQPGTVTSGSVAPVHVEAENAPTQGGAAPAPQRGGKR
jgi:hypothetical protein